MFSLISSITQLPTSRVILTSSPQINQSPIKKTSRPPSASLLYPVVNKEVEGHDIVTRETCIPTSLNLNNLGKAAVLHPAPFCGWGHAKLSLLIIGHSCVYVSSSTPHR
jgi:hypothetical protein